MKPLQPVDGYIDHVVVDKYSVDPLVLGSPFHVDCDEDSVFSGKQSAPTSAKSSIAPLKIRKENSHHQSMRTPPSSTLMDGSYRTPVTNISTQIPEFEMHRSPRAPPAPLKLSSIDKGIEGPQTPLGPQTPRSLNQPHSPQSPRSYESQESHDLHRSLNVLSLNSPPSLSYSLRSSDLDPARMLERMRRKHNCIREMYNTEWQFAQDMAVVVRIYICASASVGFSIRELDTLFTNISQVMDISLCTVAILESNIPPTILHGEGTLSEQDLLADKDIQIGKAMCIALTGQLYEVYEYYIHHNKEQMELCESLMKQMRMALNKELRNSIEVKRKSKVDMHKMNAWLERCKTRASKFTTAWALDCLLIKPIQRLGKYPLFLKTILDCSSPEDPGYDELVRAYRRSKHYLDCVNMRYGEVEH